MESTMPEPTTTEPTTEAAPAGDDGRGSKSAVLADLAAERDKRQALETQVSQMQAAQEKQTAALAAAFGLKPEETSDVSTLTATVTALQEQFTQSQRDNLVLSVANEHGITDPTVIADLSSISDEKAMRSLAGRLKASVEPATGRPRPDLTQGGATGTPAAQTPEAEFGDFLKRALSGA